MIMGRGEWNMTKGRIVKYVANTALLAVLAAAGIGVYQIGTYTPGKEVPEEPSDYDESEVQKRRRNGGCRHQSG